MHRIGAAAGPVDGFFHRLHLPYPEAGYEFFGFDEGAVDHRSFAAFEVDADAF